MAQTKLSSPQCQILLLSLFLLGVLSGQVRAEEAVGAPKDSQASTSYFASENSVSYMYGPSYRTPFITTPSQPDGADISRNTLQFKHLDFWKYGSNFVTVDIRKSSSVEPAADGGGGALEAYAVFRSAFSLNRITNAKRFSIGPLRDVAFEVGANLGTKNSAYAPAERTIYVGPNLHFKLPRGFLNVGLHFRKEWVHLGGFDKDESYKPNFNIEPTWSIPFRVRRLPMSFEGFADFNTPKGKDSFGTQSGSEFLIRPQVKFDLSSMLHLETWILEPGIGLEYWHNMYGKPAYLPGAEQLTPLFSLTIHLPGGRRTQ